MKKQLQLLENSGFIKKTQKIIFRKFKSYTEWNRTPECILSKRINCLKKNQYLVKWSGYPYSKSTWEKEANCPMQLIKSYEDQNLKQILQIKDYKIDQPDLDLEREYDAQNMRITIKCCEKKRNHWHYGDQIVKIIQKAETSNPQIKAYLIRWNDGTQANIPKGYLLKYHRQLLQQFETMRNNKNLISDKFMVAFKQLTQEKSFADSKEMMKVQLKQTFYNKQKIVEAMKKRFSCQKIEKNQTNAIEIED